MQIELDHPCGYAGGHHYVVQRVTTRHYRVAPGDQNIQKETGFEHEMPREHGIELLFEMLRGNVSEETEPPAVHTQYGHILPGERPRGAQHAAITANNDHQTAIRTDALARAHFLGASTDLCGEFFFEQHATPAHAQELPDMCHGIEHLGGTEAPHQPDGRESREYGAFAHDLPPCMV